MKIALINNFFSIREKGTLNSLPLNLAYLASCLRKNGHTVSLFDFNIATYNRVDSRYKKYWMLHYINTWNREKLLPELLKVFNKFYKDWVENILATDADIIGFSVYRISANMALFLAKEIKKRDRKKIIIFGGPECTISKSEEFIKTGLVDAIVIGEGEITLTEILNGLQENGKIKPCPGVLIKENGKIKYAGQRGLIEDLDSLPFPDFSGLPLEEYRIASNGILSIPISWSRGCIYRCGFCSDLIIWEYYRKRTPENIIREFKYQIEKYNTNNFFINDSNLIGPAWWLLEIIRLIGDNKLNIKWEGQAKIENYLSLELLEEMAKSGCYRLVYGIESGSQNIINRMKKNFHIKDAERILRDTHRANIQTGSFFMVGFPGERIIDFFYTVWFIIKNRKNLSFIILNYIRICLGSDLFNYPNKYNAILGKNILHDTDSWRTKYFLNTLITRKILFIALLIITWIFRVRKISTTTTLKLYMDRLKYLFTKY